MVENETDLNAQTEADDADDAGTEGTEGGAPAQTKTVASPEDKGQEGDKAGGKALAEGADSETDDKAKKKAETEDAKPKQYWPDDWREKMATQFAGGDKKLYQKELNRLKRFIDPTAVYGMGREIERWRDEGGLVKKPGKDAKPEEIAEFHKALGVPEKPEGYLEHIKLENGAIIGDADKPVLNSFTAALHKAGAPPSAVNAAANWYYQQQEDAEAERARLDDEQYATANQALREEWGDRFERTKNNITNTLAPLHPRGAEGFKEFFDKRGRNLHVQGNDVDTARFFAAIAHALNPIGAVTEDGAANVKSVEKELEELQALRKTDRKKYYSDAVQAREVELIAAREKNLARQRA